MNGDKSADDALEVGLWVESLPIEYQGIVLESLRRIDAETGDRYARRFVQTPNGLHFIRAVSDENG